MLQKLFFFLLLILLTLFAIAFTLLNPKTVEVNLYLLKANIPTALLVFGGVFAGALLASVISSLSRLSHLGKRRRLKRELQQSRKEVGRLHRLLNEQEKHAQVND